LLIFVTVGLVYIKKRQTKTANSVAPFAIRRLMTRKTIQVERRRRVPSLLRDDPAKDLHRDHREYRLNLIFLARLFKLKGIEMIGAEGGIRTLTTLRSTDFKSQIASYRMYASVLIHACLLAFSPSL
jgi:hypothetical protein